MLGNGKAAGREAQDITIDEFTPSLSLSLSLGFSILFSSEIYEIDSISSSNYI